MPQQAPGALGAITVTASDVARSGAFYDAVLGALGWTRVDELVDEEEDGASVEIVGWGPADSAQLWLIGGPTPTTGLHIRFHARSRAEVETVAIQAEDAGGSVQASPRRWTPFRRGEFGATVRDPAGNLIEVVAPE